MQTKHRVSALRRSQLAVSTACCGRGARFTVAKDARRADPSTTTTRHPGNVSLDDWICLGDTRPLSAPSEGAHSHTLEAGNEAGACGVG